jgi:uncharacterized protein
VKSDRDRQVAPVDRHFLECVLDVASHERVQSIRAFMHHGTTSCFEHCFHVSYVSFRICRKLGFDVRSAARGAMLHDFFLYDWHVTKSDIGLHGFRHAELALKNAMRFFCLNDIEKNIIRRHMWPLTITPPRYRESFVVAMIDKYCTVAEVFRIGEKKRRRVQEMLLSENAGGGPS